MEQLSSIEKSLRDNKCVAIGEIGIDLYWDKTFITEQEKALDIQLTWANNSSIPVILHCRESIDLVIEHVKNYSGLTGVFHAFSGTVEQSKQVIDMGFKIGVGGVVTFKNGRLDKVIPFVPLTSIVLETDSPYLAPVPHRGKRNEPAYIKLIAAKLAELYQLSVEEIADQTTNNTKQLFGI
jgi:TatD DNase family protein